jgi:hypothetical protein
MLGLLYRANKELCTAANNEAETMAVSCTRVAESTLPTCRVGVEQTCQLDTTMAAQEWLQSLIA